MEKLVLNYVGNDSWDRPVYKSEKGNLYVDANPRKNWLPHICTKCNNEFDGEPDTPIPNDMEIEFNPLRVTW